MSKLRLAAAALATALLFGAGQGLVAETIIYANNPAPGDWVEGSGTSFGRTVPVGSTGWTYTNVRKDGAIGIRTNYDFNGNGSVMMETKSATGAADIQLLSPGNFGLLKDLEVFSYSWYRDSASDATASAGPVARLVITNGVRVGSLVWEQYFNGYRDSGAPEDVWVTSNAYNDGAGVFSTYGTGLGQLSGIDATFEDWLNGTGGLTQAYGDWMVIGVNMGIGSGLPGTFIGAVDNLTIGFAGQDAVTYNFEAVPEPSSIVLSVIGASALGLICHRRRRGATA